MKLGSFIWSHSKGEARVTFSSDFEASDQILRLDAIQDCIHDLKERYKAELSQPKYGQKSCDPPASKVKK